MFYFKMEILMDCIKPQTIWPIEDEHGGGTAGISSPKPIPDSAIRKLGGGVTD
ncbi:MAG: hypothetical protein KBB78_00975 [Candidatus Pacebacteria bacterium]|nr:hypothetical protein [Candidatus Paceibacterota bacterium]